MRATYAVTWQDSSGTIRSGKLELRPHALLLEGANGAGATSVEIPYRHVSGVRVARAPADRLEGRPTLVVERQARRPILVAGVAQPGIVCELAERLAALDLGGDKLSREPDEALFFEPTPGPGDSEGGDIYAP